MASLTGQSVASSYEQLLHVDRDGGGNGTTLVDLKDGDNGTTFALQLATDKIKVNGDVGIGITPTEKLSIFGGSGNPATSGTGANGNLSVESSNGNSLYIGSYSSSPFGVWIQASNYTNQALTYPLILNPNGGAVELGGGQLQFPASQNASSDANTLDDYEEGEHTIAITGATSGSWVLDSGQTKFAYTKIGRMVTVQGKFETDSGSGAGSLKISLPFAAADLSVGSAISVGSITINRYGSTSIPRQITPIIFEGNAFVNVQIHSTDGTSNESYLQANDIDAVFEGQLTITYIAA